MAVMSDTVSLQAGMMMQRTCGNASSPALPAMPVHGNGA